MYALKLPGHVFAGTGSLAELSAIARGHRRVALLTDPGLMAAGLAEQARLLMERANCQVFLLDALASEPTKEQAQKVVDGVRALDVGLIVGLGGGSVMDAAKLASLRWEGALDALIADPAIARKGLPLTLIPTTAGTGAEATPNAIVTLPEKRVKQGIVTNAMLPDAVILDPDMTRSTPQPVAAAACVDALAHAIECFTSKRATPFSDLFALEAIRLIFANAQKGCLDREEKSREALLLAAFFGGVAIAASGTTAVHALSYPLGGRFHIPHGVANAILLAPVMRFNAPSCQDRLATVHDAIAPSAGSSRQEKAERVLGRMEQIVEQLQIPRLLDGYGVGRDNIEELVQGAMGVTRLLNNNLRMVTPEDARRLYEAVMG